MVWGRWGSGVTPVCICRSSVWPLVGECCSRHTVVVSVTSATLRQPEDWLEDMAWHRRMYRQSRFRWVPEDPLAIALTWTRGRLEHQTVAHLHQLDVQLRELRTFAAGIDDATIPLLRRARRHSLSDGWGEGLALVGLTAEGADELCRRTARPGGHSHPDARRALRGFPLPNPWSQVWELLQVRSMYAAAEDLIEDVFCDLTLELKPLHGWRPLAEVTLRHRTETALQVRVQEQRKTRGEPGDPRRIPEQRY